MGSVCITTIMRIVAVVQFSTPAAKADFTYTVTNDALWSFLEPSLGIVNVCLPVLPPVLKKVPLLSLLTSTRRSMEELRSSLDIFKPSSTRLKSHIRHGA